MTALVGVTVVLTDRIFSCVPPGFGVPSLVHLGTIERRGVEPSVLWAISSKAVKVKNN